MSQCGAAKGAETLGPEPSHPTNEAVARSPAPSRPRALRVVIGLAPILIAIWGYRPASLFLIALGIGLILGWSWKRVLIALACAVPLVIMFGWLKLREVKPLVNETAAIKAVQTIDVSQAMYQSQYGRFAESLTQLGDPQGGGVAGPSAAGLIDATLAAGQKSGYKFTMKATQSGYSVNASPLTFGATGTRTFFSDQTMVIRANDSAEPATVDSREVR